MIENLINNLQFYIESSVLLAFLAAYLGGVLISFTPCTYPLIPVTVGIIGAQETSSKLRGFILSLFYVAGLAITYSIIGAVAVLSGKLFGQMQTNPWTYIFMANLCIFMGLAMLGVFTVSLPLPQKISRMTSGKKGRGFFSSFLLGGASGLIVGPCTAPALAVLLGFVALRTNLAYGMSLLFVFAFGMGTLLIIAGTFAGFIVAMPRTGAWMTKINKIFGLILIGGGQYFLYTAGTLAF